MKPINWSKVIVNAGLALMFAGVIYVTFIYKDPARYGTPEQKAEAAFEMRSSQMQN
jgi:hypothetical protein